MHQFAIEYFKQTDFGAVRNTQLPRFTKPGLRALLFLKYGMVLIKNEAISVIIRPACLEDAKRISLLCEQLGYSASDRDIKNRLYSLQEDDSDVTYVATLPNNFAIGWVHAHKCHLIITAHLILVKYIWTGKDAHPTRFL